LSVKPSHSFPFIRPFVPGDIPSGLELCRIAGWNQLAADWVNLLTTAPDGIFSAVEDGRVWGTASAVIHPPSLGWIGMILVHPDKRGRGIAAALMDKCIAHLQANGARTIKLDATDLGRPVYLKLGFRDEQPVHRMVLDHDPAKLTTASKTEPPLWLYEFDRVAFGADRSALLSQLLRNGEAEFFDSLTGDRAAALIRPGFHAAFLGPVIASSPEAAETTIRRLLSHTMSQRLVADIFPDHTESRLLFENLGFRSDRHLMRMVLGDSSPAGASSQTLSAAGFEWG
jgi:GNAT superfamily N-acetyltransferase